MSGNAWIQRVKKIPTKGLLGFVQVITRDSEIEVIITISRTVIQGTDGNIKIAEIDHAVIYRLTTGNSPAAELIKLIFKVQFGSVQPLRIIRSLEAQPDLLKTVFINAFMISSSERDHVRRKDTVGCLICH